MKHFIWTETNLPWIIARRLTLCRIRTTIHKFGSYSKIETSKPSAQTSEMLWIRGVGQLWHFIWQRSRDICMMYEHSPDSETEIDDVAKAESEDKCRRTSLPSPTVARQGDYCALVTRKKGLCIDAVEWSLHAQVRATTRAYIISSRVSVDGKPLSSPTAEYMALRSRFRAPEIRLLWPGP